MYLSSLFRFKQKRLADLGTTHMEVVAGISQGFAALADVIIVIALALALHPSRNPRLKPYVPCRYNIHARQ